MAKGKKEKSYRHRELNGRQLRPETLMMGYGYDPALSEGAAKVPIFQTSTFVFRTAEEGKAFFELAYGLREQGAQEEPGLIYSRLNNPDLEVLEDRLILWDEAEDGLVFASGMAAIATTILSFARPGDVVVYAVPIYGGTEYLLDRVLPEFNIQRVPFLAGAPGALEKAVETASDLGRVSMIVFETPTNPTNTLVDIGRAAEIARGVKNADGHRPIVAVDNTFLGPVWQQPLQHGADLVLYSLTKYAGGHSDLIAGACVGPETLIASVRGMRTILGTMCDAFTGWLLMRSLETLRLRFRAACGNAERVSRYLKEHPKVKRVLYLGFLEQGDPQRRIFEKQCHSAGATFSFEVHGGEAEAFRFLNALKIVKLAVSLGGTESLAQHPATMTHSDIPPEAQREMGITSSMVRISVGIEHPEDIIADLAQALDAV